MTLAPAYTRTDTPSHIEQSWSPSTSAFFTELEAFEIDANIANVRIGNEIRTERTVSRFVLASEGDFIPQPVVPIHTELDRVKARLRMLRYLPENHDNEGAAAAKSDTVQSAIGFIDTLRSWPPFSATLNDDGYAVLEFEDRPTGLFADITFKTDGTVECYRRLRGAVSEYMEGSLSEARIFLTKHAGLVF